MNSYWQKFKGFFLQEKIILGIYTLAGLVIAIQHYLNGGYNNYKILYKILLSFFTNQNIYEFKINLDLVFNFLNALKSINCVYFCVSCGNDCSGNTLPLLPLMAKIVV